MILVPVIVLGSTIGNIFYQIMPDLIKTILLIILIFLTSVNAIYKGINLWRTETHIKYEVSEEVEASQTDSEQIHHVDLLKIHSTEKSHLKQTLNLNFGISVWLSLILLIIQNLLRQNKLFLEI